LLQEIVSGNEVQSEKTWEQNGDPRFLVVYMRALEAIRQIIGADKFACINDGAVEDRSHTISEMLARRYDDERTKLSRNDPSQKPPSYGEDKPH
jgi:hypothetical protein